MEQNWEDFINAIVWMIEDVEHFLLSDWCQMLTGIDGEYILRKFKERL